MSVNCSMATSCTLGMKIGNVFISVFGVLGVVTNALNTVVFGRKIIAGSTLVYMKGMAIADLVICFLNIPFGLMACTLTSREGVQYRLFYTAFVVLPITNAFAGCSVWTNVIMSVDRVIAVARPILARSVYTRLNAKKIMYSLFVCSFVMHFPFFFTLTVGRNNNFVASPFARSSGYNALNWIRITLVKFLPLILTIISNIYLINITLKSIKRHDRLVHPTTVSTLSSERNDSSTSTSGDVTVRRTPTVKVTSMLISVCCVYILCNLPEPVGLILSAVYGVCGGIPLQHFIMAANVMEAASYAITLFPYLIFNRSFREALVSVIRK